MRSINPVRIMRLSCNSCGKAYNLPDEKVAEPSNAKLRCNACGAMTDIKRQGKIVALPPREPRAPVAPTVAVGAAGPAKSGVQSSVDAKSGTAVIVPIAAAVNSRLQAALLTGFVLGFILSHWMQ